MPPKKKAAAAAKEKKGASCVRAFEFEAQTRLEAQTAWGLKNECIGRIRGSNVKREPQIGSMEPNKPNPQHAPHTEYTGGSKKTAAVGAAEATQPPAPTAEEFAALQAAKAQLEAQLMKKAQQLARATAEVQALQARVAGLEAQAQRDTAIVRDMTRQYMTTWTSKTAAAAGSI